MSKELKHDVTATASGTKLAKTDWEDTNVHVLVDQEQGDILYASSATQLSGLPHATAGNLLQSGGDAANPSWVDHTGAADPHTGYRLESADHTHQTTGAQAGKIDHGLALDGLTDDDHTQYIKHSLATAANDFLVASGSGAFVKKTLAEVQAIIGYGIEKGAAFPEAAELGDALYRTDLLKLYLCKETY